MQELINRAKELLADGTVARVLGWKAGDLPYNPEPAYFESAEELEDFVYNGFCGANLSKYMIEASKLEGKTMVWLKPCDTYRFNQLIKEHRVDRDKAYIVGVGCKGKLDIEKIRKQGVKGIESIKGAEITDEADNLICALSHGDLSPAFVQKVNARIAEIDSEIKKLECKKSGLEAEADRLGQTDTAEIIAEELFDMKKIFSEPGVLSVYEKRSIVRLLVKRIYWDGENMRICIGVK